MPSGTKGASREMVRAPFTVVIGFLACLQSVSTGCGITVYEPLYGNYNKSETTQLQRRSDIRECERRHQSTSSGPANRKAALTNLRVEQCLELRGYQRQPTSR